eukprot:scaffold173_cov205-Chaetoceros_neogracile.AAC.6
MVRLYFYLRRAKSYEPRYEERYGTYELVEVGTTTVSYVIAELHQVSPQDPPKSPLGGQPILAHSMKKYPPT